MSNINAVSFRVNKPGNDHEVSRTYLILARQDFISHTKGAPSIVGTLKIRKETEVGPQSLDEITLY